MLPGISIAAVASPSSVPHDIAMDSSVDQATAAHHFGQWSYDLFRARTLDIGHVTHQSFIYFLTRWWSTANVLIGSYMIFI